jgi:hypothetical protein
MNDLELEIRETLRRHEDDAPTFVASDARRAAGRSRRRQIMNVAGVGTLIVAAVALVFSGVGQIRTARIPADRPMPTPQGEVVRGWPDTTHNPAGVYSWDGSRCRTSRSSCTSGAMHNGWPPPGPADVEIRIQQVPAGGITDGATAATVAGRDGIYRRIDPRREWWIADIEGTTIAITLEARPSASQTDLAEAHAIIGSMRTEPRDNPLGFRLVFTLATDDWTSG